MGSVFVPKTLPITDYPEEKNTLCIGVFGPEEDFFTLKGLTDTVAEALKVRFTYAPAAQPYLHPYQCAEIFADGKSIGCLGKVRYEIQEELDMRYPVYTAQLDMDYLSRFFAPKQTYVPLPKFDVEKRDFAFVVDADVPCSDLENAIAAACPYITSVELFDVYEGVQLAFGKKSMAFSVVFTPQDKAFTDDVLDGFVNDILASLKEKFGAFLRM